jgi:hypothetical protein
MTDLKPPSRRGGRRPGSGAPKGNLNALKHGRRSRQFAEIGALLAQSPKVRETLLAVAARHQIRQRDADEVAAELLARLFQRANEIAGQRLLNDQTLLALDALTEDLAAVGRTINRSTRSQTRRAPKKSRNATHNQTPGTRPHTQPKTRYRSADD